ncbi:OmpA/MotB family protein [Halopseudomonas salegens]|uniref:Chemotaxis protein MotB n=1 Tax=Halopseudomonas salegens TaxID=1434072 RepID=A0A1H2FRJ5_9GAMM|nr:OmpA family protein [Halopseudomonas salegens]SDU09959.1 chemotaxis protein MotB [Halopseudomonas salegens]
MVEGGTARARQRDHSIAVTDSSEEEAWLITYLDVITLILVVCVVMLAFSGGQIGPAQRAQDSAAETVALLPGQDGLLESSAGSAPPSTDIAPDTANVKPATDALQSPDLSSLNLEGLGEDIDVILQDSSISFRISSEILFPSGEAFMSQAGYDVLDQLIPVLDDVDYQVSVAGHTDNIPIRTAQFPSNWELSSARAGSVVRYLESHGIAPERLTAIGNGSSSPLTDNDSAEGRAANRRVELTLEMPGN